MINRLVTYTTTRNVSLKLEGESFLVNELLINKIKLKNKLVTYKTTSNKGLKLKKRNSLFGGLFINNKMRGVKNVK